jgi:integrase
LKEGLPTKRIPSVLTRKEMQAILTLMAGTTGLLAQLLHDTVMRRNETLTLRVIDIDFARHAIACAKPRVAKTGL